MNEFRTVRLESETSVLLNRARALAMIDAIRETRYEIEEWGGWGGYTLNGPAEGHPCRVLSTWEQARMLDVHFHPEGVFIMGYNVDEGHLAPWRKIWSAVETQVPEALRSCVEGNPSRGGLAGAIIGDEAHILFTFALWRSGDDASWYQLDTHDVFDDVEYVGSDAEQGPSELDGLPLWKQLADLISPSPDQLAHGTDCVRGEDAEDVPWRETGMSQGEAVRHVIALRPLTEQVVRTLNPYIGLDDVAGDIAAIGYPQDGSQARESFEGSGSPLVAGPDGIVSWSGFALEASADGQHRIFVRLTGMAWEAVGTGSDTRIVQAEPHGGDSQRFIVQRVTDDGHYEPADTWERYSHYRILTAGSQLALEAPPEGGPLFLAAPNDGPGQRFKAEYTCLGEQDSPQRHYQSLYSHAGRLDIPHYPLR
ncbi:RICIN domain-containing protein [Streptomyces sp. NPDC088182]|uniref:RICIN domain-containing protein n=1 Tax=Streptomyces sp. NPDC088182 TaxID=3365838 RepID=UPI00380196FB